MPITPYLGTRALHRSHGRRQKPSPPPHAWSSPALAADLTWVTSPGLLRRAVRARQGNKPAQSWIPGQIVPADRAALPVTMPGGHPHTQPHPRPPRRA